MIDTSVLDKALGSIPPPSRRDPQASGAERRQGRQPRRSSAIRRLPLLVRLVSPVPRQSVRFATEPTRRQVQPRRSRGNHLHGRQQHSRSVSSNTNKKSNNKTSNTSSNTSRSTNHNTSIHSICVMSPHRLQSLEAMTTGLQHTGWVRLRQSQFHRGCAHARLTSITHWGTRNDRSGSRSDRH